MPTATVDSAVRYLQYLLVDGKFYTIFSLLFGIGFSLILARHGMRLFLVRMLILFGIGFLHLMLIWSGDILLLYAVGGLLLTLVVRASDKVLLPVAVLLILLPVGLNALTEFCGIDFAAPLYDLWWRMAEERGITEENFATWLRDAESYGGVSAFLQQGACERMWEFVEGHRLPKVLGLFMLGYLVGKHRLYARIGELPVRKVFFGTAVIGIPTSFLYAYSATHGHPWGATLHSLLYAVSVIPLASCYICGVCMMYLHCPHGAVFGWLAAPGRMALSNYIGQSLIGIMLFYGIGFGLGTSFGLIYIELTALVVFVCQAIFSKTWLNYFRFGLLEWLWRMASYRRYFRLVRK